MTGRLGARQAERLFQLSCGYIEYETGQSGPRVTREGMAALRAYVDRTGPLEIEVTPLMEPTHA